MRRKSFHLKDLKNPLYLNKNHIISSSELSEANECYKTAMVEITAAGNGDITHYPEIEIGQCVLSYCPVGVVFEGKSQSF
jgi:hypothetical protein